MPKYNVNDAWPIETPTNVEDCLKRLVKLFKSGNKLECHGASKLVHEGKISIRSKFDIRFYKKNNKNKHPKVIEKYLLRSFIEKAKPHFPSEAQQFIDKAHSKWDTLYNTGTMFIGRHYGLPSRCIDWTTNPLIALFFACSNWQDINEPGVVWRMDYNDFSDAIKKQWEKFYGKKENIEDDFENDFTEGIDRDVLTRFHYKCFLNRPIKQKAHIILSGQYKVQHDRKIYELGVRKCDHIVISANMKFDLLEKLNLLGINKITLGIEDTYIDTIASEVANDILNQEDNKKGKK